MHALCDARVSLFGDAELHETHRCTHRQPERKAWAAIHRQYADTRASGGVCMCRCDWAISQAHRSFGSELCIAAATVQKNRILEGWRADQPPGSREIPVGRGSMISDPD